MNKAPILAFAAVACLTLAACNNKPQQVDTRAPDPQASALANAAPVEPPPSITSSSTFRCQPGNTLLYVDFFSGEKMAVLKAEKDGKPTVLRAEAAGQPYVGADGSKVTGNAKNATISVAGGAAKTCKGSG